MDKVGYEVVSFVLKKREVEEVLGICLWVLKMLHGKLMFFRDKSTFGALAVPRTYPWE